MKMMRREKLFQLPCSCQVMEEATSAQLLGGCRGECSHRFCETAIACAICTINAIYSTWWNKQVYAKHVRKLFCLTLWKRSIQKRTYKQRPGENKKTSTSNFDEINQNAPQLIFFFILYLLNRKHHENYKYHPYFTSTREWSVALLHLDFPKKH